MATQKANKLRKEKTMKKLAKSLLVFLLISVMCLTNVTAFASEAGGVTPRLSHINNANFSFSATSNGGHLTTSYNGYSSFSKANLNVKVEKRSLLVFWNDVYEWNTSSTNVHDVLYYLCPLDGSGHYRATFTLTITGTDGTTDVITDTIKSNY